MNVDHCQDDALQVEDKYLLRFAACIGFIYLFKTMARNM